MKHAEEPSTIELRRFERIRELCLLDDHHDDTFDQIVALCAEYFRAPIVLISIVDQHKQWFRAKVGVSINETPRSESFCAYTVHSHEFLEVPDATADVRFKDNLLVTGLPNIRYYAGAPLTTEDGLGLGTLCVIDTVARPAMSLQDLSMLMHLAKLVMSRIPALRSEHFVDAATGIYNRTRFEEDIRKVSPEAPECLVVAVDIISPSFLDDIVKTLGYEFSLGLMLAIKERLSKLVAADCQLYRISPTRFGLMLAGHEAEAFSQAVINDYQTPVVCEGIPLQMTVGIGLFKLDQSGRSSQECVRLAISAAGDARDRNVGWGYYENGLDAAQQRTFTLLRSLTTAMYSDDQLRLVYQPRIDIITGECTSVEALLRWEHPTLGSIGPGEFIPLAEKTALMGPLSVWVLRNAIKQASHWHREGFNFKVSINVTVNDLESLLFINYLIERVHVEGVDPHLIELELTESARVVNLGRMLEHLDQLRAYGIEIAIDDFGTGYSNWSHLQQLPARVVKLDRSLIDGLAQNPKNQCMVRTLIQLACSLGYRVVAEGVETMETYELVRGWGCHEIQGYLIARPMEAIALPVWLLDQNNAREVLNVEHFSRADVDVDATSTNFD
ncbi:EAL domain-containing protein [Pseudomonas sp. CCI3.2]|uniref:sensor domain-containing phosphodiesterase n=1 Tax=unclassified Pseudomonas TaxID=196821 RepID=UPI002AC9972F|nr:MULTISPECIES: EAL domain-containing protein [unclassified Pseudomonas]MEB0076066.1 EAL domain-containing protein [Pseudomonas sp. MH10out]MEB0090828.1 EAL domain-containing protein [Pseudomonas sp. CCI4.2]MEB0100133.1 EAL domain-containing protein [Pseudomonas sp. CCI3.2]MEB0131469.1 EAL domain-containing protein [Pseudomonas sp. CCI2.4]MEB0156180.1 EAL domain-containing protein [Pseudomonas sp. AH2 (2023)]